MTTPPAREIYADTATEFRRGPFLGFQVPVNDGGDHPDWEYENIETIDGPVVRMPVRRKPESIEKMNRIFAEMARHAD